jgi:hypothetical protein
MTSKPFSQEGHDQQHVHLKKYQRCEQSPKQPIEFSPYNWFMKNVDSDLVGNINLKKKALDLIQLKALDHSLFGG